MTRLERSRDEGVVCCLMKMKLTPGRLGKMNDNRLAPIALLGDYRSLPALTLYYISHSLLNPLANIPISRIHCRIDIIVISYGYA